MNKRANILARAMLLSVGAVPQSISAQADEQAFLSDYSRLQASPDNPFDEIYVAPDALKRSTQYTAVMIDQPEFFIHPDSKYKGMKPDDMKVIADALREAVSNELKGAYQIVDEPGSNVLYVRLAVGDVMLQKKKRPILAYIPVGAVVYAAKKLVTDVTREVDLKNLKVEGEVLDSVSLEQFGAMTSSRGSLSTHGGAQPVSWEELNNLFAIVGKRLRCRLDNAKVSEAQWSKCGGIGLTTGTATVSALE
jgi:hypothetical protein